MKKGMVIIMEVPTLETDRLLLRPLSVADAEAVYVWVSDERVTKFMPYQTYTNIDDVKKWLLSLQAEENTYNFGYVLKDKNLLIGSGGIGYNPEKGSWDFGYNIRYDCWNQGLTTEAVKCMMSFAYHSFGARDFSANYAVDNAASGKVMEKCGLLFDHFGQYSKFDGSETFPARFYKAHLDKLVWE